MQRCYPDPLASADDDDLALAYAWPGRSATGPILRVNMVMSIDGGVTVDGRSAGLGSAADQRLFAVLRDLADVLLVGAGTIRAEGYGGIRPSAERLARRRRWGLGDPPRVAVVTGRGLDADLSIFTDSAAPPIVLTTTHGAQLMADFPATVLDAGGDTLDLDRMVSSLADLGLHRIHCEGGPGLLGRLVAAELVDELCLTTAPMMLGAGAGALLGDTALARAAGWRLETLHVDGDQLFSHYRRTTR